jgi:hypothetical protein
VKKKIVNTTGSSKEKTSSASNAERNTSPHLTIDDKLDKIMEATAFQTKLLASALIAFDKHLGEAMSKGQSKIIKPHG